MAPRKQTETGKPTSEDDVLRRMLQTPPEKHPKQATPKKLPKADK